jgi:hypothetical protein
LPADLVGVVESDPQIEDLENLRPVPNDQIEAYNEALYGNDGDGNDGILDDGCFRRVAEDVTSEANAFYLTYADELAELESRIENDPRTVSRRQQEGACLRGDGFEYESITAVVNEITTRTLTLENIGAAIALDGTDPDGSTTAFKLSLDQLDELRSLQELELGVAATAYQCAAYYFDPVDKLAEEIRADHEVDFVAAYLTDDDKPPRTTSP